MEDDEHFATGGPSNSNMKEQHKTNHEANTIASFIKTFNGLNTTKQDCSNTKLNSEISKLQTKLKTKIKWDIVYYCKKMELEHEFDRVKNICLADLNCKDYLVS